MKRLINYINKKNDKNINFIYNMTNIYNYLQIKVNNWKCFFSQTHNIICLLLTIMHFVFLMVMVWVITGINPLSYWEVYTYITDLLHMLISKLPWIDKQQILGVDKLLLPENTPPIDRTLKIVPEVRSYSILNIIFQILELMEKSFVPGAFVFLFWLFIFGENAPVGGNPTNLGIHAYCWVPVPLKGGGFGHFPELDLQARIEMHTGRLLI